MILKIIFLIMICIPIGCFQYYLCSLATKDLKKKKEIQSMQKLTIKKTKRRKTTMRAAK
ncbi:hypothetical protein [Anaerophilus nitritogenes]|uniref:hypothetical protein n=1 Tax=Anaerophilus nitritogenes TaxID=2498136 RepID=UPI0013EB0B22|nr:hypothetical protein [Anaerophilus nitritogenes]